MYSYEERLRAVKLYIKYDHSISAVIRKLGYPFHQALFHWYQEYQTYGDLRIAQYGCADARRTTKEAEVYYQLWSKSIGANEAVKTLAKYYDIKYNDSPTYKLLKTYARDVETGWISPNADFGNYLKLYNRIQNEIVGTKTQNGIEITGQRKHFMQRVLGTMVDPKKYKEDHRIIRRSGVSVDNIKNALFNPEKVDSVVVRADGKRSVRFIGEYCTVSVNVDTGELIQTNPRKRGKRHV